MAQKKNLKEFALAQKHSGFW